jgi:hypothetical protein
MPQAVEGLAEFERALDELPKTLQKGVLRRVALQSLEPFVAEVKALAPVDADPASSPKRPPGTLRDSYHAGTKLSRSQARQAKREGKSSVEVYAGTNDPAGVQTEFGNEHQAAQPHARQAWANSQVQIIAALGAKLWAELDKTRARWVKRTGRGG